MIRVSLRDGGRRGCKVQILPSSFNASACRSTRVIVCANHLY